jgi:hypothetical protein
LALRSLPPGKGLSSDHFKQQNQLKVFSKFALYCS